MLLLVVKLVDLLFGHGELVLEFGDLFLGVVELGFQIG